MQERGAWELSSHQVHCVDPTGADGWIIKTEAGDITVVLDEDWPFVPPDFFIPKEHEKFLSAHVDVGGKLCLAPSHSTYSQGDPVWVLNELLGEAVELLKRSEIPDQEFVDEFQSYWLRDMQPKRLCLSLLNPQGPSRMIACWHGETHSVFGETKEDVERFLKRRLRPKPKSVSKIVEEPFLWFSRGLIPSEFPKRARHLWELTRELAGDDAVSLLVACAGDPMRRVVFGFDTVAGSTMAGVTLRRPEGFTNGFREHAMSKEVALSRFFGKEKTEAYRVQRVDYEWIHSRGGEARHLGLKGKTVAILGCGSLGSGVAMLLAKSGVGNLLIVDPESLSWDNIGRHSLGAVAVGQNKAEAMAAEIEHQLPSIYAKGIRKTWQQAHSGGDINFGEVDLVISTSGDWSSDSMLNVVGRTTLTFPQMVFGWFEAHALAGHALLIADNGGCFGCGADEFGNFSHHMTVWPQGSAMLREPACGGYYQPYGPAQMAATQGLVATLAVDALTAAIPHSELRSWVAAKRRVEAAGGHWSDRSLSGGVGQHGGFLALKWSALPTCGLC
jgi:hypothetical protein